jgi:hypothetical protein
MERYSNLSRTTVVGGYTAGSGVLNVTSTVGDNDKPPFPTGPNFRVALADPTTGAVKVLLKVTGVNSSTQWAVTPEGADANASADDVVRPVLTAGALDAIKQDAITLAEVAVSITITPSYSNAGGTGDRRTTITLTPDANLFVNGDISTLLNGAEESAVYVPNGTGFIGKALKIDFGEPRVLDQIRVQLDGNDQGTWQVSGSNDDLSYTNIGSPVAWTTGSKPILLTFANATGYRYYKITGASGSVSQNYWREMEFRIGTAITMNITSLRVGGVDTIGWGGSYMFAKVGEIWKRVTLT